MKRKELENMYNQSTKGCSEAVAGRDLAVVMSLKALGEVTSELDDIVARLENRLVPVLQVVPKSEERDKNLPQDSVYLAERIEHNVMCLMKTKNLILDLMSRLEI